MLYLIFLYCSLADPSYETREFATDRLCELVSGHPWFYGPRLVELAREASDPEVRFRVRQPIMVYDRWRANSYVPSTVPVWPQSDMYPIPMMLGDARSRRALSDIRSSLEGRDNTGPRYYYMRRTTEIHARELIMRGATYQEVDALLLRMWKLELADKSDCKLDLSHLSGWRGGYLGIPPEAVSPTK